MWSERVRVHSPMVVHWLFSSRPPPLIPLAQDESSNPSWMSSPACGLQDVPVPPDLAPEHATGGSLGRFAPQPSGNSDGTFVPSNHPPTAASRYANTDRPC